MRGGMRTQGGNSSLNDTQLYLVHICLYLECTPSILWQWVIKVSSWGWGEAPLKGSSSPHKHQHIKTLKTSITVTVFQDLTCMLTL